MWQFHLRRWRCETVQCGTVKLRVHSPNPENGPRSIGAVKVLRISVTDRCNYRCVYCMPADGVAWLPKDELLTFEEIAAVAGAASRIHGIRRFKLTGGEPTLRRGIVDLVYLLSRTGAVDDLSLTTNGQLLPDLARPLREAGLDRITVSLDSLRPDRFLKITRTGDLATVLRGIDRAVDAGIDSIKINCVVMRGVNDDEAADFARLTLDRPVTVRFIEYMPLGESAVAVDEIGPRGGCGAQQRGDVFVAEDEIRSRIEGEMGELEPVDRATESGVGPAVVYRVPGAVGRVGFISAMSKPFCSTCNRLRLTATGVLRSCLFEGGEVDIKPILRGHSPGAADDVADQLAQAMVDCVRLKPETHSYHGNEQMSRIGG
ncbi:MAG: GTP 3',8-cyclase MoaA [Burkholderiales bacterium]|nr:GTP 3',8-cyclase MoaA [Phycisphaerae bacterium]